MSLDPLFAAPLVVQVHAFAAMAAFVLGIVQFAAPKGTLPHRTLGYIWVGLMLVVAASSFSIHGKRPWGSFSAIHSCPSSCWFSRRWRSLPRAGITSTRIAGP